MPLMQTVQCLGVLLLVLAVALIAVAFLWK